MCLFHISFLSLDLISWTSWVVSVFTFIIIRSIRSSSKKISNSEGIIISGGVSIPYIAVTTNNQNTKTYTSLFFLRISSFTLSCTYFVFFSPSSSSPSSSPSPPLLSPHREHQRQVGHLRQERLHRQHPVCHHGRPRGAYLHLLVPREYR